MKTIQKLYPKIEPYNTGMLEVSNIHTLYYEECGNPNGKPVVFLHGGPGGGTNADCRRFFNPKKYHIVLFHQRGCGKSTPHASLEDNTTWDLVTDIEKLRNHLNIETWQVFGGSWGSTLALAYAQTYPEKVTELILRGIFMCRKKELQWFYQEGASKVFPDKFEPYLTHIPKNERGDLITAYHKRLIISNDPKTQLEAAHHWTNWEKSTSYLLPQQPSEKTEEEQNKFALAFSRIENHYFVNNAFMDEGQLLHGAHKIAHIPTIIVQGRYDVVCPAISAWELHKALPKSKLHIIPNAGHSSSEVGIIAKLVEATDKFI